MSEIETIKERDLWGPHRGVQIKLTELHGTVGGAQWKIEREPFWQELSPLYMAQARASYRAFCAKPAARKLWGVPWVG